MATATRQRPRRQPPPAASIEEITAEGHRAPLVDDVTQTTAAKIIPTRWKSDSGRWLYVAEIDGDGGGRDPTMAPRQSSLCASAPRYGIFADRAGWKSTDPPERKMERMLVDRFPLPYSSFQRAQEDLDEYGSRKGWTPDPPLTVDDDEPKPVRRGQKAAATKAEKSATEPDVFEHDQFGIFLAAEKYLRKHGVAHNRQEAWLVVLPNTAHVRIEYHDWESRVQKLFAPWREAGWQPASIGDEFPLIGTIENRLPNQTTAFIPVGLALTIHGISLHAVRKNEPLFCSSISETGYHSFSELEPKTTKPADLQKAMRRHVEEFRKEAAKKRAREERQAKAAARKAPAVPSTSKALVPVAAPAVSPITAAEKRDLAKAEATIAKNQKAFLDLGRALAEIRDRRLYRADYESFEQYVRERWGFGRQEAADKIAAAKVAALVSPIGDRAKVPVPLVEDHLKALAPALEDPKDVQEIYRRALKRSAKEHVPLTGKLLREERVSYLTPPEDLAQRKEAAEARNKQRTAAKQRQDWDRTLAELAQHVEAVTRTWTDEEHRQILAAALREWAAELES